jgi:hypothetical protein
VNLPTDGPSLFGDEASEVSGVTVQRQDPYQPVERGNVGQGRPLFEGLGFRETLADPSAHPLQVSGTGAGSSLADALQCSSERIARRQQHPDLLAHDRKLQEDPALPTRRLSDHLLLDDQEGEQRRSDQHQQGQQRGR